LSKRLLTRTLRRVEASADVADLAPILTQPSARQSLQLCDRLEDEVLALWRSGNSSPAQVLETVDRLRRVRAAIERRFQDLPGAPLVGLDGLEFLIEFVHDIRSPLSSVQLLADRLQQGWSGPVTPLQQRQLRLIYAATHALTTVTGNALQMTREWNQLEEPEARPFSVTRLLSEVQDIVRTLAVLKGLEVTFIRPDMDRRLGHPIELQRILLNLVTNALKFTRTGSITVSVTDQPDDRVEFAVQDTGPGIDEAVQDTLFQPFRHVAGDRATFSATGLGLAITQRLVRALGGQLEYETAADKGTRFYFILDLPVPGKGFSTPYKTMSGDRTRR
jgi:signal transduction histidine kinase